MLSFIRSNFVSVMYMVLRQSIKILMVTAFSVYFNGILAFQIFKASKFLLLLDNLRSLNMPFLLYVASMLAAKYCDYFCLMWNKIEPCNSFYNCPSTRQFKNLKSRIYVFMCFMFILCLFIVKMSIDKTWMFIKDRGSQ